MATPRPGVSPCSQGLPCAGAAAGSWDDVRGSLPSVVGFWTRQNVPDLAGRAGLAQGSYSSAILIGRDPYVLVRRAGNVPRSHYPGNRTDFLLTGRVRGGQTGRGLRAWTRLPTLYEPSYLFQ